MIVFAQAASVAKKKFRLLIQLPNMPGHHLGQTLVSLQRKPGTGKSLLPKDDAEEDTSHSHYPLA